MLKFEGKILWAKAALSSYSLRAQVVLFCAPPPLGVKCSHCSKCCVWTRLTRKHWEALDKSLGFSCCCGFTGGKRRLVGVAYCSPSALHVSALSRPDAVNHGRDRGRQRGKKASLKKKKERAEASCELHAHVSHAPPPLPHPGCLSGPCQMRES